MEVRGWARVQWETKCEQLLEPHRTKEFGFLLRARAREGSGEGEGRGHIEVTLVRPLRGRRLGG